MTKTKSPEIEKPVWLKYTEEEVKAIIQKLAKKERELYEEIAKEKKINVNKA